MIHYIIPLTTSPAMKSPCFKFKSISYEKKINKKNINTIFQGNVFENDGCRMQSNVHVCSAHHVWNGTFAMNFITVIPYLNM